MSNTLIYFVVHWVRGHQNKLDNKTHQGCVGNEIADYLAKLGRFQHQRVEFKDRRTIKQELGRIEKEPQKKKHRLKAFFLRFVKI